MNIKRANGTRIMDVAVDDDSYIQKDLMAVPYIELRFTLPNYTDFPVGCYCDINGERYTLQQPPSITKVHSQRIEYNMRMYGAAYAINKFMFVNTFDAGVVFDYTATPLEHITMLVASLNRHDTGWSVGDYITGAERLVSYNHNNCADALNMIADAFNTEWEINGKVVSLKLVEHFNDDPLPMSYGKGNGFKSGVGRTNEGDQPAEYIYPQGSSQNLDPARYTYNTLRLPVGQTIGYNGEHYSDEVATTDSSYIFYKVSADGRYIEKYPLSHSTFKEKSLDCTDIFPMRKGVISSVVEVDSNAHYYDVIDSSIPAALDYSACLIANDQPLVITFQSGMLAGREFNCGYIHSARRFEIEPKEYDGVIMPGGNYMPAADDEYIITNCHLPDAYICDNTAHSGAAWDMFRKCIAHLFHNEKQGFTFKGDVDSIWLKNEYAVISPYFCVGGHITFSDVQFTPEGVVLRVAGVKTLINDQYSVELTLTNIRKPTEFMTDYRRIANNMLSVSADRYFRRRDIPTGVSQSIWGTSIVRPTTGSSLVGRLSTSGENFVELRTWSSAQHGSAENLLGIMSYNFGLIAQGKFTGFKKAKLVNNTAVAVSDGDIVPTQPTIKDI